MLSKRLIVSIITVTSLLIIGVSLRGTLMLASEYFELNGKRRSIARNTTAEISTAQWDGLNQDQDPVTAAFAIIGSACQTNNVTLIQVLPGKSFTEKTSVIRAQQIILQGSFIDILKCVRDIQQNLLYIKITSLIFEIKKHNKLEVLQCQVYFQNVGTLNE